MGFVTRHRAGRPPARALRRARPMASRVVAPGGVTSARPGALGAPGPRPLIPLPCATLETLVPAPAAEDGLAPEGETR